MKAHPYADKWRLLEGEAFETLCEDIAANGLNEDIVTFRGQIADGRNRHAACLKVSVEPRFREFEGSEDDLLAFIESANAHRRHDSPGQVAASRALMWAEAGRREDGRWVGWSRTFQSSGKSSGEREAMRVAGIVLDHLGTDALVQVRDDSLSLNAALTQAEQARDAERNRLAEQERLAAEEADAKAFVTEQAPDLATRVDGEDLLTYVEARDLWNRRNREEAARIKAEKAKREAEQRAEREQAEQEVQTSARALLALAGARHPEWRQRVRAAHAAYPEAVEPTARAMWSPENVRLVSTWLSALAKEMEPGQ